MTRGAAYARGTHPRRGRSGRCRGRPPVCSSLEPQPRRSSRADQAKLEPPTARNVEDWIKRIRDLKTEGRSEEAAKELAAFRVAFGERADALLPADLQPRPR